MSCKNRIRPNTPIPLDAASTALQNFAQSAMNHSRSGNSVVVVLVIVKARMKRHDHQLTALVLTLLKIYVVEAPWTRSMIKVQ